MWVGNISWQRWLRSHSRSRVSIHVILHLPRVGVSQTGVTKGGMFQSSWSGVDWSFWWCWLAWRLVVEDLLESTPERSSSTPPGVVDDISSVLISVHGDWSRTTETEQPTQVVITLSCCLSHLLSAWLLGTFPKQITTYAADAAGVGLHHNILLQQCFPIKYLLPLSVFMSFTFSCNLLHQFHIH